MGQSHRGRGMSWTGYMGSPYDGFGKGERPK
ncbi:uncharacterized protein G2W53_038633 [Senna tora]|uniref:Uncharacterized protein n=1 Tax=Senna tora TaxID=362788 RepID=A0A834SME7_9FABA|nr:uncharacterized protein G2W53_038633 [Senna tora]